MSTIPLSELATTRRWQTNFLAVLPAVRTHAKVCFGCLRPEARAEATAETIARAFTDYGNLAKRRRLAQAYTGSLADYAVRAVRGHRCVGGHQNCRDVLNPLTQKTKGITVRSLSPWDSAVGSWKDVVLENRRFSPADAAAFRIDFQNWLKAWPLRHRAIIKALAAGNTTTEVAMKFRVSLARISQLRAEYRQSWERFQSQAEAPLAA